MENNKYLFNYNLNDKRLIDQFIKNNCLNDLAVCTSPHSSGVAYENGYGFYAYYTDDTGDCSYKSKGVDFALALNEARIIYEDFLYYFDKSIQCKKYNRK